MPVPAAVLTCTLLGVGPSEACTRHRCTWLMTSWTCRISKRLASNVICSTPIRPVLHMHRWTYCQLAPQPDGRAAKNRGDAASWQGTSLPPTPAPCEVSTAQHVRYSAALCFQGLALLACFGIETRSCNEGASMWGGLEKPDVGG